MRFESFAEMLAMGGHGPYVWSAYAIALLVLVANVVWPLIAVRRNLSALRRQEAHDRTVKNEVTHS